jgi:hypothetical protein
VADYGSGLHVIDVANPALPVELGAIDTPGYANGVSVVATRAYVADAHAGLRVIDVSNPALPVELGSIDTPGTARAVSVMGTRAYLADDDAGLRVIDVSNPALPVELGSIDTPPLEVSVVGTIACVVITLRPARDRCLPTGLPVGTLAHMAGYAHGVALVGSPRPRAGDRRP